MNKTSKHKARRWSVVGNDGLHERIRIYQFKKKITTHAEATRRLLEKGLQAERA